jgi:phosphate transport system ATP-binding protein
MERGYVMNHTGNDSIAHNFSFNEMNQTKPSPSPQLVISIEQFDFFYHNIQALKQVTIPINRNKVTAFIGPSGCGKTTMLRSINRMNDIIPNTSHTGTIRFNNQDIYAPKMDVVRLRYNIGMVFQKPNPFPKSIFDNVAYGPRLYGIRKRDELYEIVESSLQAAALWDEVKDRLKESALNLSGGQQQRLCIARTLANQPNVILMDEPTSALDPGSTLKIEELIHKLKQKYTIIIVNHNMQQASRVSDYTAFFYEGVIVEMDQTDIIFTSPSEERTEAYITGKFG